jgi:hypothetical protein
MRARRFSTTLLFFLPLVALTFLAVDLVRRYYRQAERDVRPVLEQELTRTLEHEVRIGKVTIRGGFAYLDDVRLSEGKTFADVGGREIAHARQVVIDVDLRRILLSKDKTLPLFAHADVIEPVGYVRRNAAGRWNFEDLFKRREKPPARPGIGTVTVQRGTVYFDDEAMLRHQRRPRTRFSTRFDNVNGTMQFYGSRGAAWQLTVGGGELAGPTSISGSYDPLQPNLLVRVEATRARLRLLSRFLPPDFQLDDGLGSGRITVARTVNSAGKPLLDYQANIVFTDGSLASSKLREPITNLRGAATIATDVATLKVDGRFAGSDIHAEGTVLAFADPAFHGWAQGSSLQLGRMLTALKVEDRAKALKGFAATATLRANLSGRIGQPIVTASGPVSVRGPLPGGAVVGESGTLQVSFAGTFKEPRLVVSGTLPLVRYRGYFAKNVRLSAVYDGRAGGRGGVDLNGEIGGGSVAARANLRSEGKQVAYRVFGRVRGVDLEKLPIQTTAADRPIGKVTVDLAASGKTGDAAPRGDARIEATELELGGWAAERVQARVRSDGKRLFLEPAVIEDSKGLAIVTGSAGLRDKTLDLRADVDNLDLSVWPAEQLEGQPGPATPAATGLVFLRDVAIGGTTTHPRFAGKLYGYNLRSDRLASTAKDPSPIVDYAAVKFRGDEQSMAIEDGRVYRFPSSASVTGLVFRPLSRNPRLDLNGAFDHVDVTDLASLADVDLDASGLVQGSFEVLGTARQPQIVLPNLSVQSARVGDFDFHTLTASLRYAPFDEGGLWTLDNATAVHARPNVPPERWTRLTASGRLDGAKNFRSHVELNSIDLDLVEPYLSEFVTVDGEGEAAADLSGRLVMGKAEDLTGEVTLSTRGLTVNKVAIGDLRGAAANSPARLTIRSGKVTSSDLLVGSPESGLVLTDGGATPALQYDLDTDAINVNADVRSINIDLFRQVLRNSPFVSSHPESVAARWLKPISNPFEGTISGTVAVAGTAREPVTTFDWKTKGARIQGNAIDAFEGSITFTTERIDLKSASLTAGETTFNASGSFVPKKSIAGNVDTINMPLSLVQQWFPGRPILRDLEGVAESVHLTASGDPDSPTLTASVLFKDVLWIETTDPAAPQPASPTRNTPSLSTPEELTSASKTRIVTRLGRNGKTYQTTTTGREVWISSLDTSTITVNAPESPRQIRADDIHVTLREPDPFPSDLKAPRIPLKSPREFKIYAKGRSEFDWANLDVLKNPEVNLEINVPSQSVEALIALLPKSPTAADKKDDIVGTLKAGLVWTGRIQDPIINGTIEATADHIRLAGRSTQIKDLNAAIDFDGDALKVRSFSAFTEIVDPKTGKVVSKADPNRVPLKITGGIALTEFSTPPAEPLHIVGDHIQLAEANLGSLKAARFVTDDTHLDLTLTGWLMEPLIKGVVEIRTADIRLPEDFVGGEEQKVPAFQPAFDIRFVLGEKVRIVATPLSAVVRTSAADPIELRGDLIGGDVKRLRVGGTLVVNGGTLAFPTARFTIQRGGRVQLRYPYYNTRGSLGSVDPTLGVILHDLRAVTHMTAAPANNPNLTKRYTITVEANGPLNSGSAVQYQDSLGFGTALLDPGLHLTFRADPPDLAFTDAELRRRVTARLGGESAIQGLFGQTNIGRIVRQQVTDVLSESFLPGLLENLGVERAFGLEEFAVDISQLNTFALRLSRRLFGPVYLGYWQRLSGPEQALPGQPSAWQFKLSYRFKPQVQFSFTTDDQRTNAYLLEGVFRF